MNNEISTINSANGGAMDLFTSGSSIKELVTNLISVPVMTDANFAFLVENAEHFGKISENTFIWRTNWEKRSIVNKMSHPTDHSGFHQAILEQKVQFEQTLYLIKDYESKLLDIQEKELEIEEINENPDYSDKRKEILTKKIELDLKFANFELQTMRTTMEYRMKEVKGWNPIIQELHDKMVAAGMTEEQIWNKEIDEDKKYFFLTLYRLQGIDKATETGEFNNLMMIAMYAYDTAKKNGRFEEFMAEARVNNDTVLLQSVSFLERWMAANQR